MGDRSIDSLFQRQCSLSDPFDSRHGHAQDDSSSITILEIGGKRPVDTHCCSGYNELRHYFDTQNRRQYDEVDPFFDESRVLRPRSMKLLFFSRCEPDTQKHLSLFSKAIVPDSTEFIDHPVEASPLIQDDEPHSPSSISSRRPSALISARRPPFVLDTLQEEGGSVMRLGNAYGHDAESDDKVLRSWTWDLRYARSTAQTVADRHTTTYFCMNFPSKLRKRISDTIHSLEALAKNPLFMDTLIIDEMIAYYRDAIKTHRSQLLAINDDDSTGTEMTIKLEELATQWRTILQDIHSIQTHIRHLRELAETRMSLFSPSSATSYQQSSSPSSSSHLRQPGAGDCHQHIRQKSSDVFGPPAGEIFHLQSSTCEFWTRCVNMYLERTTDRIRNSTYRLRKTIPLRRRGSLPQLNRRLSNFTVEVAVQFQRNSSSVSTLALSFFSTIFFSPDGLLFAITYWWWILVTLIVPLTCIILHLWFETLASNTAILRRRRVQQQQRQEQQFEGLQEEETD